MKSRFVLLASAAKHVFEEEGLVYSARKGMTFITDSCFKYGTFYVAEITLRDRDEADFLPKYRNYSFQVVYNKQQAEELEANGFKFLIIFPSARTALDKGAIAFCIFVGKELASISWAATTNEAKSAVDNLPFKIDFSNKEACTGGNFTLPKFRGQGFMPYCAFLRQKVLKENGIKIIRYTVNARNITSQKAIAKFDPKIIGKGRYLKILWWRFWKEIPLISNNCKKRLHH